MAKVRIVTNTPGAAPKASTSAEIKGQGRIPYGKTKEVKVPTKMAKMTARGMGAATKGGSYIGVV
jgi:hypothetical protein|tara:strand:+ start:2697 stop:2891 length:195 start_codon:yes stop_codon:yes gene_type:complete